MFLFRTSGCDSWNLKCVKKYIWSSLGFTAHIQRWSEYIFILGDVSPLVQMNARSLQVVQFQHLPHIYSVQANQNSNRVASLPKLFTIPPLCNSHLIFWYLLTFILLVLKYPHIDNVVLKNHPVKHDFLSFFFLKFLFDMISLLYSTNEYAVIFLYLVTSLNISKV